MRTQFLLPVIGTVAILTAGMASAQTYSTIDVPGGFYTVAEGINDRSEIVGVFRVTGDTYHGFLRSKGQFTTIDGPNAEHTFALGINNRTQIVGWYVDNGQSTNGPSHGFLWEKGTATTFDPPGATSARAYGINDLGQIVGTYVDGTGSHNYLWTHGQFVTIPKTAYGINRSGQVVGSGSSERSGFRLEPNGTVTEFGGNFDYPNGINDRGEIIGSAARPVLPGAFLYAYGMYSFFKFPGSGFTNAYGINNRGQIVGAWTDFAEPVHGFVLTPSNEIEDVSASASPDGTRIPVVSVIADDHLTTWTLGPGQEIRHDGVQAHGGYGSQILWWHGAIYVLGDDYNWWRWDGTTWIFAGSTDPAS